VILSGILVHKRFALAGLSRHHGAGAWGDFEAVVDPYLVVAATDLNILKTSGFRFRAPTLKLTAPA